MMLTIDVCLIVFCLKSFICITHCVTLIPSRDIALSYLFAKVIANKFLMSLLKPPLPHPPIEKSCVRHWVGSLFGICCRREIQEYVPLFNRIICDDLTKKKVYTEICSSFCPNLGVGPTIISDK